MFLPPLRLRNTEGKTPLAETQITSPNDVSNEFESNIRPV